MSIIKRAKFEKLQSIDKKQKKRFNKRKKKIKKFQIN